MQIVNIALRNMSPLPRLCLIVSAALGFALPALAEKPKFATIDISKAFEAYHLTVTEKAKIKIARETLRKESRRETLKLLEVEVSDLKNRTQDPTLSEKEKKEAYRRYMMKNYEKVVFKRERDQHIAEQLKLINETMVKKTYEILADVRAVVQKIGEGEDYDYIFEMSGKTSSQIAPLIYIRDATDITDQVIAVLNKDKPAEKEVATTANQ